MRANPFLLIPLVLLVACGGGGGGGGGTTTPPPAANQSLSGRVTDGYVSGANVCLDQNGNGQCDAGEPAATTDSTGAYTLTFPVSISLTGLNVMASVPAGAVDSDAPGTPISVPYVLAAPAAANMAGILNLNPLLTLVTAQMHANSALTLATATTQVLSQLGLTGSIDPKADYLASGTTGAPLHYVNQMLAVVMQNLSAGQPLSGASLTAVLQAAAPYANPAYQASSAPAAAAVTQSAIEAAAAGALIAAVPAFSYTNPDQLAVANGINTLRSKLPVGLVSQTTTLDTAAANHASYLQGQGFAGDHTESSSQSGYTGATPAARAATANYLGTSIGENIVLGASSGVACFAALENSVYHLAQLLAPFLNVGVAFDVQPSGSACVVEVGNRSVTFGQYAPSGTVGVYPASGQTGVPPTYYNQFETPNPLPQQATLGHAVVVSLYSLGNTSASSALAGTDVVVHSFTLMQGTTPVSLTLLAAPGATSDGPALVADSNLPGTGLVVALPAGLAPNTRYTASFTATVQGTAVNKSWTFTTGAQN